MRPSQHPQAPAEEREAPPPSTTELLQAIEEHLRMLTLMTIYRDFDKYVKGQDKAGPWDDMRQQITGWVNYWIGHPWAVYDEAD